MRELTKSVMIERSIIKKYKFPLYEWKLIKMQCKGSVQKAHNLIQEERRRSRKRFE